MKLMLVNNAAKPRKEGRGVGVPRNSAESLTNFTCDKNYSYTRLWSGGATRPLSRDGGVGTQQSGQTARSGPEVKNGRSAKDGVLERRFCRGCPQTLEEEFFLQFYPA